MLLFSYSVIPSNIYRISDNTVNKGADKISVGYNHRNSRARMRTRSRDA